MRYLPIFFLAAFASCGQPEPETKPAPDPETEAAPVSDSSFLDPLKADGEHYKFEFENDYVRVLREKLAAGEGGAMHSHRARVSVYLKDAKVTLTPRGGEPVEGTLVAGTTSWSEATTHQGVTQTDLENLSIELKDLTGPDVPAPELDAVEVDPEHHTVDFENDRVRVVRMIYPPNSSTTKHAHRPGFGVALTPVRVQNITDTDEVSIEYAPGQTFWTQGGSSHITKNVADEELVIVLVELKRKPS